ncbi:hypothetical protein ACROYT_G006353 [Oculina patagonica]
MTATRISFSWSLLAVSCVGPFVQDSCVVFFSLQLHLCCPPLSIRAVELAHYAPKGKEVKQKSLWQKFDSPPPVRPMMTLGQLKALRTMLMGNLI